MLTQIRFQAPRLRETPHMLGRDLAIAWRREVDVFAAAEIGWIAEEAHRTCARLFGPRVTSAVIHDAHRAAAGFALLAAHPRIRLRAERILGTSVTLQSCQVICARDATLPTNMVPGVAMIVVPLAASPAIRPGAIFMARPHLWRAGMTGRSLRPIAPPQCHGQRLTHPMTRFGRIHPSSQAK